MSARAFCTIVDAGFLPRFLVMQRSLARWSTGEPLHVLCMDRSAQEFLERAGLPDVELVELEAVEAFGPELEQARQGRTLAEYCWTVKPTLCKYMFERLPDLEALAYVDADLAFYAQPAQLFDRFEAWSALVVPHQADGDPWAETHGIYNAGFVAFRRGDEARRILDWWSDRCVEWCFARVEDGKFSDQKYLDGWPHQFRGVRVLEEPGVGLAPWNAHRHRMRTSGDAIYVDDEPLVFFHFQSFKVYGRLSLWRRLGLASRPYQILDGPRPLVWTVDPSYVVSPAEEALLYRPYLHALLRATDDVRARGVPVDRTFARLRPRRALVEASRRVLPKTVRRMLRRFRQAGVPEGAASTDEARRARKGARSG